MHLHLVFLPLMFLCQNIAGDIMEGKLNLANDFTKDNNADMEVKNPIEYIHQYTSNDREQKRVLNRKAREENKGACYKEEI